MRRRAREPRKMAAFNNVSGRGGYVAAVGVIGTGLMGTACVERLKGAGFEIVAYDVDEAKRVAAAKRGARAVASVAEVATHCETIVLCVFTTDQVEQVVEGKGGIAEAAGEAPRVVICTSTCDPDRLAALAPRVETRGVRFLEVPVSGTSRQVADGEGVGLIGGDREEMERAGRVLDAICPRRFHLGAVGNGSRTKLAVNLILGLNRAAMAEGFAFAERLGLDTVSFLEVAKASACHSQVMDVKGHMMARREFDKVQGRVDQTLKDYHLMLEQARKAGQDLPFATVNVRMLEDCVQNGEAGWDNTAILEAVRRRRLNP
jgi:L-threonate 2-dehydrogenase